MQPLPPFVQIRNLVFMCYAVNGYLPASNTSRHSDRSILVRYMPSNKDGMITVSTCVVCWKVPNVSLKFSDTLILNSNT